LCCKVLIIPEVNSPRGEWCQHYRPGRGCSIYETRPAPCRGFLCTWLLHPEFGDDWRPDIAGFFMWEQPVPNGRRLILEVDADRPQHWKREPYWGELCFIATRTPGQKTVEVLVRISGAVQMLFPEGLIELGPHRELAIESGYRQTPTGMQPYARYLEG
jgi:hypothetical protein